MKDIVDSIAQLRVSFLQENMNPPSVILLEKREDGMRLLSYLRDTSFWTATIGDPRLGQPIEMYDGSVYMELELMGMKVRWPANRYATRDGSWSYA